MKVICIDNTGGRHPDCVGDFMVKEGRTYTVSGSFERNDEYWYQLKEDKAGNGWNSIYFIPLSNTKTKILNYESETI